MASALSPSPSTAQASNNSTPALGAELSKAEARQAKNLWVTSRVIDGLMERIVRARRELDGAHAHVSTSVGASTSSSPLRTPSTTAKSPSDKSTSAKSPSGKEKGNIGGDDKTRQRVNVERFGGGTVAVLSQLSKDVEGMKPLDSVGSEHKNFHATISKLAKAAEKVCMS